MYSLNQVRWELSLPATKAQEIILDSQPDQESILQQFNELKLKSQIVKKGDRIEMIYYTVKMDDYLIFSSYEEAIKNQINTSIEPGILMEAFELTL